MDNATYLYAALAVTIVAVLAYLFYLSQRARELEHDLQALESQERPDAQTPGGRSA